MLTPTFTQRISWLGAMFYAQPNTVNIGPSGEQTLGNHLWLTGSTPSYRFHQIHISSQSRSFPNVLRGPWGRWKMTSVKSTNSQVSSPALKTTRTWVQAVTKGMRAGKAVRDGMRTLMPQGEARGMLPDKEQKSPGDV